MAALNPIQSPDTRGLVKEAATALLQEGIRPTVANVRARIGRGSAGTINEALKDWWEELGERLQNPERQELPAAVLIAAQTLWHSALDEAESLLRTYKDEAAAQIKLAEAARDAALLAKTESEKRAEAAEVRVAQMEQIRLELERALADEHGRREAIDWQLKDLGRQLEEAQSERRREQDEAEKRLAVELQRAERTEQRLMMQLDEYKVTLKHLEKGVTEERLARQNGERELQDRLRSTLERATAQKTRADGLDERLSVVLSETQTVRNEMKDLLAQQSAAKSTIELLEGQREQVRGALAISETALSQIRSRHEESEALRHRLEATCEVLREENAALRKLLAGKQAQDEA